MKIKIKIKSFPAEAGPTGGTRSAFSGTGFSREEAGAGAINFMIVPALRVGMHPMTLRVSGLTDAARAVSGTGFSREGAGVCALNFPC